jgi:hypothetical protein
MSHEQLPDRWSIRDFPVLVALARKLDDGAVSVSVADVQSDLGQLDEGDVIAAMRALTPGYVTG